VLGLYVPFPSELHVGNRRILMADDEGTIFDDDRDVVAKIVDYVHFSERLWGADRRIYQVTEKSIVLDRDRVEMGYLEGGKVYTIYHEHVADASGPLALQLAAVYFALLSLPKDIDNPIVVLSLQAEIEPAAPSKQWEPPTENPQIDPRQANPDRDNSNQMGLWETFKQDFRQEMGPKEPMGCGEMLTWAVVFCFVGFLALLLAASTTVIWVGMMIASTVAIYLSIRRFFGKPIKEYNQADGNETDRHGFYAAVTYGTLCAAWIAIAGHGGLASWKALGGLAIGILATKKLSLLCWKIAYLPIKRGNPNTRIPLWLERTVTTYTLYGVIGGPIVLVGALYFAARMPPTSESSISLDKRIHTRDSYNSREQDSPRKPGASGAPVGPSRQQSLQSGLHSTPRLASSRKLPDFSGLTPILSHTYNAKIVLKRLNFKPLVSARYVAWECLSEQEGQQFSSAAEVSFLDEVGMQIPAAGIHVIYADSEELKSEKGEAKNVLDGDSHTIWHSAYSNGVSPLPHVLVFDLGRVYRLKGFQYLPRQNGPNGRVKECRIYAQEQPFVLP